MKPASQRCHPVKRSQPPEPADAIPHHVDMHVDAGRPGFGGKSGRAHCDQMLQPALPDGKHTPQSLPCGNGVTLERFNLSHGHFS